MGSPTVKGIEQMSVPLETHPLDDPAFGMTKQEPVFYFAHPLAPDDRFTFKQNMDHALKMMRLCFDEGFRVVAPWHTICQVLDDREPEHRRVGLEIDCFIVEKLQRIILCGHKISRGMGKELSMIGSITSWNTINLVGMDDETARCYLRARRHTIQAASIAASGRVVSGSMADLGIDRITLEVADRPE